MFDFLLKLLDYYTFFLEIIFLDRLEEYPGILVIWFAYFYNPEDFDFVLPVTKRVLNNAFITNFHNKLKIELSTLWTELWVLEGKIFNRKNLIKLITQHRFHVLSASSLPFLISCFIAAFLIGQVLWLHTALKPNLIFLTKLQIHLSFLGLFFTSYYWSYNITKESAEGHHTYEVQKGLLLGFYLFLITEIMLFFSFFWSFFWLSFNPHHIVGNIWPPQGTQIKNATSLPLFNTIVLLVSGYTITLTHRTILNNNFNFNKKTKKLFLKQLFLTIMLGLIFLISQKWEYTYGLHVNWSKNAFWSCFFLLTGFHGIHVLVGTILLIFNLERVYFARNYIIKKDIFFFAKLIYAIRWNLHLILTRNQFLNKTLQDYKKKILNTSIVFNLNMYLYTLLDSLLALLPYDWKKNLIIFSKPPISLEISYIMCYYDRSQHAAVSLFLFPNNFFEWTRYSISSQQHLSFEIALFYWHFVDIVWIFLYFSVYFWGFKN